MHILTALSGWRLAHFPKVPNGLQKSRPTMAACGLLVRSSCPRSAPPALVSACGSAVVIGQPENLVGAQPLSGLLRTVYVLCM